MPMEPRSPPPFSLPANVTNRLQTVSAAQQFQDFTKNGSKMWAFTGRNGEDPNHTHLNNPSAEHHFSPRGEYGIDHNGSPSRAIGVNSAMHKSYHAPMAANDVSKPISIPPPNHSYFAAQNMGGPVLQPMQAQQYGMSPYQPNGMVHVGMEHPIPDQYNTLSGWDMYGQTCNSYVMQPAMSAHQVLAVWQQHYNELDQQLKNIDRHRAMHSLEPHLAEQRRVIVQQRSDAKDIVREYQGMLGLKRMTDSSDESFTANFNVDAPAYVPAKQLVPPGHLSHQTSFDAAPVISSIEKPRSGGPRRAIPIVPPRDAGNQRGTSHQSHMDRSTARDTKADGWGVSKRTSPPQIQREQSELSEMIQAEQEGQMSSPHELPTQSSESQDSSESSEIVAYNPGYGASMVALPTVIPANDSPPRDPVDEYKQMIKAIGQPKGTVTKLRLLTGSVMDVDGQAVDLSGTPLPSAIMAFNDAAKEDSIRDQGTSDGRESNVSAGPAPDHA